MMKKNLFLAALAIVALASCTDSEFVGDNSPTNPNTGPGAEKAIVFNSGANAITRASWTGKDAATLLNNEFVFAGTKLGKESTPVTHLVFDQYYAKWMTNTANTTESNSNDWEYVGYTPYGVGNVTISTLPTGATQTIKYWDYNTTQYDFAAYSLGVGADVDNDPSTPNTYATASKIDLPNKASLAYTLIGTADQLKACYISDLVTAYNQSSVSDYNKVVTFSFRSLAAKIRLAFFETVPGYSIKSVKFYDKAEFTPATGVFGTTAGLRDTPILLNATDATTLPTGEGTMTITFPTTGFDKRPGGSNEATDYNKAHIAFAPKTASDRSASLSMFEALADFATAREGVLDPSGNYLGRASNVATYAGGLVDGSGKYYTILPNEDPANLMIRIKYTLVSTDGSGEEIVVNNASAVIPKELAKWSPNYAYTYIFKISDLTNGSTGTDGSGNIVCGLTPITLNAVVVDSEDGVQETITSVSHPSITTYEKGVVVTEHDEYTAGYPIYVIVNNGTENITLTSANAKLYTATVQPGALQGITEESVDNALRYGVISTTTTTDDTYTVTDANSKNLVVTDITPTDWLVKKIDAGDSPTGNEIVLDASNNKAAKFTPATGTVYVFQYQVAVGTANSLSAVAPDVLAAGTYYTYNSSTSLYDEMTVSSEQASAGTYKVITGTTYYTKSESYVLVQAATLTNGNTYYTSDSGTGGFVYNSSDPKDPKTTNYYEKVVTYTAVPYKKLTKGTTYYTSDRGAGAFVATGSEVVDAENKYFSGTLGTPAKYQYKVIKVKE
jgi:hypothetical protein